MISIHCIILLEEKPTMIFQNYYYFPWYSSQSDQNYKRQSVQKYVHLYKVKSINVTFRIKSWNNILSSKLQKVALKYVIHSRKKWDIRTGWQNRELLILWFFNYIVDQNLYKATYIHVNLSCILLLTHWKCRFSVMLL